MEHMILPARQILRLCFVDHGENELFTACHYTLHNLKGCMEAKRSK